MRYSDKNIFQYYAKRISGELPWRRKIKEKRCSLCKKILWEDKRKNYCDYCLKSA